MTRREELCINYEDALFALLMDAVAEEEGKRLIEENERLKADPRYAVPKELDERMIAFIREQMDKRAKG